MRKKLLAIIAAGGILIGSIMMVDRTPDFDAFPSEVVELVVSDADNHIHADEGRAIMDQVDDILKKIQADCDDLDVQSLEQYKSLRSMLRFTRDDHGSLERVIVVNEDHKREIELAAKNLADRLIELCQN